MPSSPPGAEARVIETGNKPNPEQLTLEEVGWIINKIREKIAVIKAEEERKRKEKSDYDDNGDPREKPVFKPTRVKLKHPENWQTHFSIRDGVKNQFGERFDTLVELQPTAIHAIAQKYQRGRPIHANHIRPSVWEYLYSQEFAQEIRGRALQLLSAGPPPEYMKNWRSEKVRPKSATLFAMEAIREFFAEHEIGAFEDYIDKKGYFIEYAAQETIDDMHAIYRQLRIQKGYKNPAYLTEIFTKRKDRQITPDLSQVMSRLESYRADNPGGFRPAITRTCTPITSIRQDLYERVRDSYLGYEGPKANWTTLAQIKKKYDIKTSDATLRKIFTECLGGEDESEHIETRRTPGGFRTKFYSPEIEARMAEEAERRGFLYAS
ncbi:hypothetical protein JXD20_03315 [Candidatus Peregrinibacteria bacterium]|nr:hypothetical protein [Candidatus Peregrinibacteria bacterium]